MKKIRYDSAMGALFSESARGLNVQQQTDVMTALSRAFGDLNRRGVQVGNKRIGQVTLGIDWLQNADNQRQLTESLPVELRGYVNDALKRLEHARVKYDDDRRTSMITMPAADGQS